MKKIFLIILISSFALSAFAQEKNEEAKIEWMSFEEAIEANATDQKKFFIDVYTDWCGWCKRMDATTFQNKAIIELLNESYHPVKLDAEMKDTVRLGKDVFVNEKPNQKRNPHQLAIALLNGKLSYPSVVFLDEQGNMIQPLAGYQKAEGLEPILSFFAEDRHLEEGADFEKYLKNYKSKANREKPN
ncbi:MAG: DUF255 domain-containing protein [Vicingaceae bacterium]